MQELDTSDEGVPGRHRVPGSPGRRMSTNLGIAALGLLVAAGPLAGSADLLGLRDAGQVATEGSPPQRIPQAREEEPRPRRTLDLTSRPTIPPPQPEEPPVDPVPQRPTAADPPEPAGRPSPAVHAPAPAPTVRTGESCAAVGQTATTRRGGVAVCTASPGNGPNKWRAT